MGTWNHKKTKLRYYIFLFVAVYHMFSNVHVHVHVEGSSKSSFHKTNKLAKHEGTIKIMQSDDGEVIIDCVDIYKQPAFNHPLLENHTIQMKPGSYPRGIKVELLETKPLQSWQKNIGECPEGTIPILRSQKYKPIRTPVPFVLPRKDLDNISIKADPPKTFEYAQGTVNLGNYFGASAWINVWNPKTVNNELSAAQIWVFTGQKREELNTVQAGWMTLTGQDQPLVFIYWTADGYQSTGCYNLQCPGFVQTNKEVLFGGPISRFSTYGGQQYDMKLHIHKDQQSGNWWLRIEDRDVGYWPGSLFKKLADRADAINWGGDILNKEPAGNHTTTQMGSGHFPNEGLGKACFFRNLMYIDESGAEIDASNVALYATKSPCYDVQRGNIGNYGVHFFFGGPGYSDTCRV